MQSCVNCADFEYSALGVAADVAGRVRGGSREEVGGICERALRRGDLIHRVNGRPVQGVRGFLASVNGGSERKNLTLEIIRNQQPATIVVDAALPDPAK